MAPPIIKRRAPIFATCSAHVHCITSSHQHSPIFVSFLLHWFFDSYSIPYNFVCILVNPRRACAARVTVVVSVSQHLTSRTFACLAIGTTYSTGSEGQNFGWFSSLKMLRCRARTLPSLYIRLCPFYSVTTRVRITMRMRSNVVYSAIL